jgi:hypothetical protein
MENVELCVGVVESLLIDPKRNSTNKATAGF